MSPGPANNASASECAALSKFDVFWPVTKAPTTVLALKKFDQPVTSGSLVLACFTITTGRLIKLLSDH